MRGQYAPEAHPHPGQVRRPPGGAAGGGDRLCHRPDLRPDRRRGGRDPPVHHEQPRCGPADRRQHLRYPASVSPTLSFSSPALRAGEFTSRRAGQISGSSSAIRRV